MSLRVLSVASEVFPLVKTGGLADVAGALPRALERLGVAVSTLLPGYPAVLKALPHLETVHAASDMFGGPARLLRARASGLDLLVLDAPHLYARAGGLYADASGRDWPDNALRFGALARMAAEIGLGRTPLPKPEVVHAHDWQAGLAPAYLHYAGAKRPGTMITIHNLAFQGRFEAQVLAPLGLPPEAFHIEGVEYFGGVGFLKAGLRLADRITTVSPTYAAEIQRPQAGMGLDGLLRHRADRLSGILNGIDTKVWNPAHDPRLPAPFEAARLDGKMRAKQALQQRLGLDLDPQAMVVGVVSRLSWQKGLDLLLEVLPHLLAGGGQLALLGAGEAALEDAFRRAASDSPGAVGCAFGYDEGLAHLIQGGSDFILVPSRFEPCGLTQLCALRYGSPPIVTRVGGLADTVIDANFVARAAGVATGIVARDIDAQSLAEALDRAAAIFALPGEMAQLRRRAMATEVSWDGPAQAYLRLYQGIAGVS
ncbi:glycogen synthase GlgA [Alsobacter soli]|uniref:Glycogen synthase n=1 Tax=Alsobacter soli TaxID=2109933 RepID=A0A2T1HNR3_9HYPH|nr:glycogen synthase GlgA [Alsobacter soli]PSC03278.1 glycogen synthase GlgA [Alsobacter soli]